jgi:hypothetical protein
MTADVSAPRQLLTPERETPVPASWGGASLGAGAMLVTIGIILYIAVYGRPAATGPDGEITVADHATYLLAHWELLRRIWLVEMGGELFMALGAFLLQQRRMAASKLPSAVAWLAVGLGATVLAVMHAFIIGSYPAAAAAYAREPALFTALQGGATVWFYAGTAALFAGLTAAFTLEAAAQDRVISQWIAILGGLVAGVAAVVMIQSVVTLAGRTGFVSVLRGSITFALGFGCALLSYAAAALLGVAIWKRTRVPAGTSQPR